MTLLPLRLALLLLLSATLVAQSPDVVKPGDNLLAEGIPPIPASLAETVARYTEFRSAALRRLASDAARDAHLDPLRRHATRCIG